MKNALAQLLNRLKGTKSEDLHRGLDETKRLLIAITSLISVAGVCYAIVHHVIKQMNQ